MGHLVLCCALFILCGVAYATVELEEGVNQLQNWSFEKGFVGLCAEQIDGDDPVLRRCMVPSGIWEIEDDAPGATGRIELDDREAYSGSFSLKMMASRLSCFTSLRSHSAHLPSKSILGDPFSGALTSKKFPMTSKS